MKKQHWHRDGHATFKPNKRVDVQPSDLGLSGSLPSDSASRFAGVTTLGPICLFCQRFFGMSKPGLTCQAFPDGIPAAILTNGADHRQPFTGDRGLHFSAKDHQDLYEAERIMRMVRLGGPLPEEADNGAAGRE